MKSKFPLVSMIAIATLVLNTVTFASWDYSTSHFVGQAVIHGADVDQLSQHAWGEMLAKVLLGIEILVSLVYLGSRLQPNSPGEKT